MPQIIVLPWCPDDPRTVLLPSLLSHDYLLGKAEAVIQAHKKTDIYTYLQELSTVYSQKPYSEVLHIASPDTVREIEAFIAYNFDKFPLALFLPSPCGHNIEYVISPDLKNNSAVFYMASVMRG